MRRTLLMLWCLVMAGSSLAVTPGTDLFVPAVAHGTGYNQAQWRADVWIFNPSDTATATVTIYLLLRQPNPNPTRQVVTVNPGESMYFKDIVGVGLFQQTDASGGLRITSNIPVLVTAESYNNNVTTSLGTGTSGQFFGGVPAGLSVGANDATDVIGLDQDGVNTSGKFRSNLALVETTGAAVDFVLDRYDPDGTLLGSWACDGTNSSCAPLGPWEVRQFNLVLSNFTPGTGTNQRIRVRVPSGAGRLIAVGSRVDNATTDPSTIEMSGGGRVGTYLCKLERSDYEAPLTLTVDQGAVTALDATILFTDADVPSCGGQIMRLTGPLQQPVLYDDQGSFGLTVGDVGLGVTLQVNGTITTTGSVAGNATVTLTGVPGCNGSKAWPFVGVKLQ
ncbi:MAG: hypothetical protein LAO05_02650 [Acidobacteriia bacterium]|nr:hypothetical protein [Terriglobia bacterium]